MEVRNHHKTSRGFFVLEEILLKQKGIFIFPLYT